MDPKQDSLAARWPDLKGQVRQRWAKLTDDDFAKLTGKAAELTRVLQQRYGYGQMQAAGEINHWLRDNVVLARVIKNL
ncbi:MAG: hypothetical protein ABIQ99_08100 [Thermoflexales bacterium]